MRVGLHALGIGAGARPEVIRAVAMAAEAAGFATLWAGEHALWQRALPGGDDIARVAHRCAGSPG